MKRIITYLYEYQNGLRRSNAGFFRLDLLGDDCRIQLNMNHNDGAKEQGKVYFVLKPGAVDGANNGDKMSGVYVGDTSPYFGRTVGNWIINQDAICGSPFSFDDVHGMAVRYPSGRYLASCWEEEADERFLRGDFTERESFEKKNTEESVETDKEYKFDNEMMDDNIIEDDTVTDSIAQDKNDYDEQDNKIQDVTEKLQEDSENLQIEELFELRSSNLNNGEVIQGAEDMDSMEAVRDAVDVETAKDAGDMEAVQDAGDAEITQNADSESTFPNLNIKSSDREIDLEHPRKLQRMDISDIRSLPKKNWHLCSNSFLIHGFFNYHYLVRKDVEEDGVVKSYLGVPGVYEKPERAMAMLFGFPEFEPEAQDGSFGYWYCRLEE